MRYFYGIHDFNPDLKKRGALPLWDIETARKQNQKGFGILMPVNDFASDVREKANITRLNAAFVDLDDGTKSEQMRMLEDCPLIPSMMVESKNGFHAYWVISNNLVEELGKTKAIEVYEDFLARCLIPYFNADNNAKDSARLLRVPGFLHQKDPTAPFMVRLFMQNDREYTWEQITNSFPPLLEKKKAAELSQVSFVSSDSFWDRAGGLNCEYALSKLSGSGHVSGERYTFTQTRKGTKNIVVDGRMSSCWVDERGMIGSSDGGGPTIIQWLAWFKHSKAEIAEILKEFFPELVSECKIKSFEGVDFENSF